jgi:hypothetical protein
MNIKLVQLINNDYIICDLEELDEEPSLYMKHPYKVDELSYWDYNEDDKHYPPFNAVFLRKTEEKNTKKGEESIVVQTDYAQLTPYPPFTNDTDVLLNSDRIMTIIEPKPEIAKLYMELIAE